MVSREIIKNPNRKAILNLKQCREILKEIEKKYSDEEVLSIRDFLYKLAKIYVDYIKEMLSENRREECKKLISQIRNKD